MLKRGGEEREGEGKERERERGSEGGRERRTDKKSDGCIERRTRGLEKVGVGDPAGEAPARLVVTIPRRRPPAPSRGERGPTPVGEDSPWRTCTQNILSRSPRCGSCAGRDAGYHVSTVTSPFRPGVRPGGRRPGPARIGLPLWEKEKERTAGKAGGTRQRVGQGCGRRCRRRAENSKGPATSRNSIKGGFSERGLNRTIRYENSDNTALVH